MDFLIKEKIELTDGTFRFQIGMKNRQLIKFGYILESLEGWCNYTTPEKTKPILQVDVAPDYISDFNELLKQMAEMDI